MNKEMTELSRFILKNSRLSFNEIKNLEEHEIRQQAQMIESELKMKNQFGPMEYLNYKKIKSRN